MIKLQVNPRNKCHHYIYYILVSIFFDQLSDQEHVGEFSYYCKDQGFTFSHHSPAFIDFPFCLPYQAVGDKGWKFMSSCWKSNRHLFKTNFTLLMTFLNWKRKTFLEDQKFLALFVLQRVWSSSVFISNSSCRKTTHCCCLIENQGVVIRIWCGVVLSQWSSIPASVVYSLGKAKMVLMSFLNKLKEFIVWSWTYLWAFWFLLVSWHSTFELVIYHTYLAFFLLLLLGCFCALLSPRTFKDCWKRRHGNYVLVYFNA